LLAFSEFDYEISGWLVPVGSQANYSLKRVLTEDFSHIRPTRSLADMPPNEGRASTALNRV